MVTGSLDCQDPAVNPCSSSGQVGVASIEDATKPLPNPWYRQGERPSTYVGGIAFSDVGHSGTRRWGTWCNQRSCLIKRPSGSYKLIQKGELQ